MSGRRRDDDTDATRRHRRTFLAATGSAGMALLAGCTDNLSAGGLLGKEKDSAPSTPQGEHEADVTRLLLQGSGEDLSFEVTVQNRSGTGEVDWWQVELADGSVGNDDPIFRQEVQVPEQKTVTETVGPIDDGDVVVVRAHHSEGGYGGKAIVAKPSKGKLAMVRQGKEPSPQGDHSFNSGFLGDLF